MAHSIIGVYESYSQARDAMNELLAMEFDLHKLHISPDREPAAQVTHASSENHHGSGIGHFFRALFGGDEHKEREHVYSEAVRRGNALLRVDVQTETEADRAIEVMQRYDPMDIDGRSAAWKQDGWSGFNASAPAMTEEEIREDRRRYSSRQNTPATVADSRKSLHVYPTHHDAASAQNPAQNGAAAFRQEGDSIVDKTHAATTGEASPEAPAARMEEDADFRDHWQHAYGQSGERYEEYDAAYRYGSSLSGSDRIPVDNWDDAEPAIRQDWETQHPESTWERVREAVRYGAHRPRNGMPR